MMYAMHGSNSLDRCPHCRSLACGRGKVCSACGLDKTKPKPKDSTAGMFKNFLYKIK